MVLFYDLTTFLNLLILEQEICTFLQHFPSKHHQRKEHHVVTFGRTLLYVGCCKAELLARLRMNQQKSVKGSYWTFSVTHHPPVKEFVEQQASFFYTLPELVSTQFKMMSKLACLKRKTPSLSFTCTVGSIQNVRAVRNWFLGFDVIMRTVPN